MKMQEKILDDSNNLDHSDVQKNKVPLFDSLIKTVGKLPKIKVIFFLSQKNIKLPCHEYVIFIMIQSNNNIESLNGLNFENNENSIDQDSKLCIFSPNIELKKPGRKFKNMTKIVSYKKEKSTLGSIDVRL